MITVLFKVCLWDSTLVRDGSKFSWSFQIRAFTIPSNCEGPRTLNLYPKPQTLNPKP